MNNKQKDHTAYYPIILTQKNWQGNNTFRYEFPSGSISLKKSSIGVESIDLYYSWANITTAFNNRILTIGFPETAGIVYNQIIIPEGFYSIQSLNAYLQFWMIDNNYYLIDDMGNYIFYVEILANETFYGVQVNLYDVPTTLPVGWTNPGWSLPTVSSKPIFVVGDSNNFGKLIGFSPDAYNADSQISDLIPQLSPVNAILVTTGNLDNKYSNPSTILASFSVSNAEYGSMINFKPTEIVYVDVTDCSVSYIDIELKDQDFNALAFKDPAMIITLIIKVRE